MGDRARALRSFAQARWSLRFRDRNALHRWQARGIAALLRDHAPRAAFYRHYRGASLDQLPIVDKATVLTDFASFNTYGISLNAALGVATAAERSRDFAPLIEGLTVGLSSGTSGTRGVFLVSAEERQRWAGLVLARLLTPASLRQLAQPWRGPLGIGFFLRANSNLYETVASRRLRFTFHDLLEPMARHVERLNREAPDVLVAPPTVLHQLAMAALAGALSIRPRQIVSVAEVIEPDDRDVITRAFAVPIQEVYQATEGFLAVTCPAGRLHLNEEFLHVEPEWLDAAHRRFRPIVTDFTRTTQLVIRYRLDDVLREAEGRCACGRVTRGLEAVEGRADDVLWWPAVTGGTARAVFPDTVRRSMALAGALIGDYRIEQHGGLLRVQLSCAPHDAADAQAAVRRELDGLCHQQGLQSPTIQFDSWVAPSPVAKRRRIRCAKRPDVIEATV